MSNSQAIGVAYADPALNSFEVGTATVPIGSTVSGNLNQVYAKTTHTSGDFRGYYSRVEFAGAGAGETLRALSRVTAAQGSGQTTNGAHISLSVNTGGSISGAGNALRATIGGSSTNPGGTLAALQLDSDFASGGTWSNTSFLRVTNSGTGEVGNFAVMPAVSATGVFRAKVGSPVVTHTIPVTSGGTTYYIMVSTVA
ncbi:hypothetical protein UFOVP766_40 [uncultured Caudovirales phage]|uniref:Uncharacterized protein n=1 Tax=uncultured Caudovirales phage TaxID=2100421 RepID=A0A6J5NW36_9CAUD|nr:hypothetical protein UFOVP766_40 [uncultured Caudovirales phage]